MARWSFSQFDGAALLERLGRARPLLAPLAFGAFVYVLALAVFFPYERVKQQIVAIAASQGLDAEVGSVGPAFGVGVTISDVVLATRPSDGKKPTKTSIAKAKLLTSLWAGLRGEEGYEGDITAFGGQVSFRYEASLKSSAYGVKADDLALNQLPGMRDVLSIPFTGSLGADVDLRLPTNRYATSEGHLAWTLDNVVIGDGKSKLKVEGNPLMAEGITVPRVRIGKLTGEIVVEKGVGHFRGVHAQSPDLEAYVEGEIRLSDPLPASFLDIYVRFKLADALVKRDEKLSLLMQLADMQGKRPDGFYGFRLTGLLRRLRPPEWSKNSPFANAASPGPSARPRRPAVAPPVPSAPVAAPPAPPPPPVAAPPAVAPPAEAPPAPAPSAPSPAPEPVEAAPQPEPAAAPSD